MCAFRSFVRVLCALQLVLLATRPARSEDLSGSWKASELRVAWAIGEWGESCGPRPAGGADGGGQVELTASGSDFKLSGLSRNYSSTQCWEQLPGLGVTGHSASTASISTTCKMPKGDPRQATVVTTWAPRGDTLYFNETGQYQLVTQTANCTASVRRTRLLTRVVAPASTQVSPATVAPPAAAAALPSSEPDAQKAADPRSAPSHCEKPGPPTRLEVSPKTKLMRAGETFGFRAEAFDARGCRAHVKPVWSLQGKPAHATIDGSGKLTIAAGAASGLVTVEVSLAQRAVLVSARVVSSDEYEQLLAGGGFGAEGESLEQAVATLTSSEVAVEPSAGEQGESRARWHPVLIAGAFALAAILAALGFFWSRRRPEQTADPTLSEPPPSAPSTPSTLPDESPPIGKVCPVCARRYPRESTFCGQDGTRLVRVN